ncbi:hypothetical protein HY251_04765 [bacterium]|nr:hypothetical protein [bacterium]
MTETEAQAGGASSARRAVALYGAADLVALAFVTLVVIPVPSWAEVLGVVLGALVNLGVPALLFLSWKTDRLRTPTTGARMFVAFSIAVLLVPVWIVTAWFVGFFLYIMHHGISW